MYILDTDICSYTIKNRPSHIAQKFESIEASKLTISSITGAELLFGAKKIGSSSLVNLVEGFLGRLIILPWGKPQAYEYANLRTSLEQNGKIIGNMDMLIASHALSIDAVLVSNNLKHFEKVPNLKLENWV